MLTLIAHLYAKPERLAELDAVCKSFIVPTRAESGCVQYHFHKSVDDPLHFVFYETWRDRQVFEAHLETPHLKNFWENRLSYLQRDVELSFYETPEHNVGAWVQWHPFQVYAASIISVLQFQI
jgi:quinol monooxygenase YgiN